MAHDFTAFPELTNSQMQIYYFESPHKQITESFRAKVVKVTDADTIRVEWSDRDFNFPIRLIDISAPEMNEAGGERGKKWLESEILNEKVDIIINPKRRVGKWGRILGEIIHRGLNINEEAIRTGHAVPFDRRKDGLIPDLDTALRFEIK
jgi:micrococcal nuclease|tara:strand:+ start:1730 stop:2179 length:450 start_codon:yes stop_codon:yes gene_type:complete